MDITQLQDQVQVVAFQFLQNAQNFQIPTDVAGMKILAVQGMNTLTLVGSFVVKAPQIINIWRNRSVAGLAEHSFVFEAGGLGCGVAYNLIRNHPFATWGELMFLFVQCILQLLLFWRYKTQPRCFIPPRLMISTGYLMILYGVYGSGLPQYGGGNGKKYLLGGERGLQILGSIPMVVGTGSRVPQILQNFRQRHTGTLSLITWVMSLGGNIMRVLTTLAQVDDIVTLAGHVAAMLANLILVGQILVFWRNTNMVLEVERKKMAEPVPEKKKKEQ